MCSPEEFKNWSTFLIAIHQILRGEGIILPIESIVGQFNQYWASKGGHPSEKFTIALPTSPPQTFQKKTEKSMVR